MPSYTNMGKHLFNARINYLSDDIRCMLLSASYTPDQDAHDFLDDVVANEVTGTGYTAGGKALTTKTIVQTDATNTDLLDCDDVVWTAATITARYAVFYDNTPSTNATKPLISYQDLGATSSTNSTFEVKTPNGIYSTVAA